MKKISIYEPAMCCSTGLCGVGVDSELLRITTLIDSLKKKGIEIERYNLSNAPMKFVQNASVNKFINTEGVDALPLILVNDEIKLIGRYPTKEELSTFLEVSINFINE